MRDYFKHISIRPRVVLDNKNLPVKIPPPFMANSFSL